MADLSSSSSGSTSDDASSSEGLPTPISKKKNEISTPIKQTPERSKKSSSSSSDSDSKSSSEGEKKRKENVNINSNPKQQSQPKDTSFSTNTPQKNTDIKNNSKSKAKVDTESSSSTSSDESSSSEKLSKETPQPTTPLKSPVREVSTPTSVTSLSSVNTPFSHKVTSPDTKSTTNSDESGSTSSASDIEPMKPGKVLSTTSEEFNTRTSLSRPPLPKVIKGTNSVQSESAPISRPSTPLNGKRHPSTSGVATPSYSEAPKLRRWSASSTGSSSGSETTSTSESEASIKDNIPAPRKDSKDAAPPLERGSSNTSIKSSNSRPKTPEPTKSSTPTPVSYQSNSRPSTPSTSNRNSLQIVKEVAVPKDEEKDSSSSASSSSESESTSSDSETESEKVKKSPVKTMNSNPEKKVLLEAQTQTTPVLSRSLDRKSSADAQITSNQIISTESNDSINKSFQKLEDHVKVELEPQPKTEVKTEVEKPQEVTKKEPEIAIEVKKDSSPKKDLETKEEPKAKVEESPKTETKKNEIELTTKKDGVKVKSISEKKQKKKENCKCTIL